MLNARRTFLLAVALAATGCKKGPVGPVRKEPSLLMMYSQEGNTDEVVQRIASEIRSADGDWKKLLFERLFDIYNPALQDKVLIPLVEQFEHEPDKMNGVLEYFSKHPPRRLTKEFYQKLFKGGPSFSGLLDIYLVSESTVHLNGLIHYFQKKKKFKALEVLQYAELLFLKGKFEVSDALTQKILPRLDTNLSVRGRLLLGKLAFYEKKWKECADYLLPIFNADLNKDDCVEYLVDSFIMMNELPKAFRVVKVYSMSCFENSKMHLLKAKTLLFAKHVHEARKSWDIARTLGATGEKFQSMAFFLSLYWPEQFSKEQLGEFRDWSNGRVSFGHLQGNYLAQMRRNLYATQYGLLGRHDEELARQLAAATGVEKRLSSRR